jgi:hypothetical protein
VPREKEFETPAERQRAYRERQKREAERAEAEERFVAKELRQTEAYIEYLRVRSSPSLSMPDAVEDRLKRAEAHARWLFREGITPGRRVTADTTTKEATTP